MLFVAVVDPMYTLTTLVYLETCLILVLVRRDVRTGLPITTVAVVATSLDVVRRRYPLSRTLTPSGINLYSCPLIIALEVVPAASAGAPWCEDLPCSVLLPPVPVVHAIVPDHAFQTSLVIKF